MPGDPAASEPAATVVADKAALAAVLRDQVRAHADQFLSWYRPSVRLPRCNLLGAFFDGLDGGICTGGAHGVAARERVLADAATFLPGGTREFRDASTLYLLTDVSQARVSHIEHGTVSTYDLLARYLDAIGGQLESLPFMLDGLVPQLAAALDGDPATR